MRWGECLIGDGQKERILSMALVLTVHSLVVFAVC
jgi:hypothetical protein